MITLNLQKYTSRKKLLTIGVASLLILVISQIWALNRLSALGEKITEFEVSAQKLKLENKILRNQVAQKSSLNQLENLSLALGFRSSKKVEYFKTSDVALNH